MSLVLSQIEAKTSSEVGAKARLLAEVAEGIGHVPPFVAIPTSVVEILWQASEEERVTLLTQVLTDVKMLLPDVSRFAIRSAGLNEDQIQQSMAGQFYTAIDIDETGFLEALSHVIEVGVQKSHGRADQFSCFIQAYLEADLAGVTFTRGPEGDPRLWIEYHEGRGEELVSGQIEPMSVKRFWGEENVFSLPGVRDPGSLLLAWKDLEARYEHPQDIEWCVGEGEWYLLQTRPITTIHADVYQGLLEADTFLPVKTPFWYEQTEIAELAPHPCGATLSLLEELYLEDGPIARVYASLGVTYYPRDFLCIVAGQLYVDREEELRTLFPEYTVLRSEATGIATARSWFGMLKASYRQRGLRHLNTPTPIQLQRLEELLRVELPTGSLEAYVDVFLQTYEQIFATNLATQQSTGHLIPIIKGTTLSSATIIQSVFAQAFRLDLKKIAAACDPTWIGNGLDVADTSVFAYTMTSSKRALNEADRWWTGLSALSRTAYEPVIRALVQGEQLREVGRWVTVRWINGLRERILAAGAEQGLSPAESLQMTLEEWSTGLPDRTALDERVADYERSARYKLPARLTNLPEPPVAIRGLSSGVAEGTLCDRDTYSKTIDPILWTEELRPELAPLLPMLKGIVSRRGGMLSHLAIIAREQNIPVLSGVELASKGLALGSRIQIDGGVGTIEVLS